MMTLMLICLPLSMWTLSPLSIMLIMLTLLTLYPPYCFPLPIHMSFMTDMYSLPILILCTWIYWISSFIPISPNLITLKQMNLCHLSLFFILTLSFLAHSLITFYILFEASIIPISYMILKWGYQPARTQAALSLLLYMVCASLPLLLSILFLAKLNNMSLMMTSYLLPPSSLMLSSFMLIAPLVKIPMYFIHLWLPKAHVEAPVTGSMILAALLLKLGTYLLMRISMMMPWALHPIMIILSTISMWGGTMAAIQAAMQPDMKSLIAYSSIAHMSFIVASLSSLSLYSSEASTIMMITHGLTSSCLFAFVYLIYLTSSSRALALNKAYLWACPPMLFQLFLAVFINMSAPPSTGILAEIYMLTTIHQ
uniref:NADH-ubiquinone oxidoreductase chain 4 n=1 Tax=Diurodrilus subterraneus TaxID=1318637 RepID=M9W982_9ANNE|nr:NADH dehydrogenase subunit 4 [Diurodrilus subterraneus]